MDNLGRAFTFMFEDDDWLKKTILGGILILTVIGIPFVIGYLLELAKQSYENREIPLPEWDNMGDKFVQGLVFLIILIIYSIPLVFFMLVLPCFGTCLSIVYGCAVALVIPYITLKFALTRDFNVAIKYEPMFEFIKENIGDLVIVVLISIGLGIIATFGMILMVIGLAFTGFWAKLGSVYLFGKLYQKAELVVVEVTDVPPEGDKPSE
ncbi:MAG: DUF4013 domain-containing protein [candidate division Zixibacteria bacterium]|nr:DUF4013 domain-containing protein [candidate division Zixibacteria bacterium]